MKSAPPLSPNDGRIIIFYPRLPMAGFNPIPFSGAGGAASVAILVDNTYKTTLLDQTFVFIDLPAGSHTLTQPRGWFSEDYNTPISLEAGDTKFVELVAEQFKTGPPAIVPPNQATEMLTDIHHGFKKPLPFNRQ
jgi:hypothetical protein